MIRATFCAAAHDGVPNKLIILNFLGITIRLDGYIVACIPKTVMNIIAVVVGRVTPVVSIESQKASITLPTHKGNKRTNS